MLKETDRCDESHSALALPQSGIPLTGGPPSTGVLQVHPAGVGVPHWGLSYGTVPPKGWHAVLFIN